MDLNEILHVDRCRDMDELINFEPDPDYSPDAGTGLLSPISYKRCYMEFYVGTTYTYWRPAAAARRGFKMVLLTALSEHLCRRYMHSTECPSS